MKTLLINASPKKGESASRCLVEILQESLGGCAEQIELRGEHLSRQAADKLAAADQWVFVFPLYYDALPSHLLSCLMDIAAAAQDFGPASVYGVVNCGFYEGEQTRYAFEVLANWAEAAGFPFGGGVGIGGGGAIRSLPRTPSGPMGPAVKQLAALAARLRTPHSHAETTYATPVMPRQLYKIAGEAGWRHDIRKNGGRRKDLWNQPGAQRS